MINLFILEVKYEKKNKKNISLDYVNPYGRKCHCYYAWLYDCIKIKLNLLEIRIYYIIVITNRIKKDGDYVKRI